MGLSPLVEKSRGFRLRCVFCRCVLRCVCFLRVLRVFGVFCRCVRFCVALRFVFAGRLRKEKGEPRGENDHGSFPLVSLGQRSAAGALTIRASREES